MAKLIGNFERGSREPIDKSYTVLNLATLTAETVNPNPYTSLRTWVESEQKFYLYDSTKPSNTLNGWYEDNNQSSVGGISGAANVGASGVGLYRDLTNGTILNFKKIVPGTNITITDNNNGTVTISSSTYGSGGGLSGTGVAAGTYTKLTVNSNGLVTSGSTGNTLAYYGITDATPSSHVGSGGNSHSLATHSIAGFMSSTDKQNLDSLVLNGTSVDLSLYQKKIEKSTVTDGSNSNLLLNQNGFTYGNFTTNIPKNNNNYLNLIEGTGTTKTALVMAYGDTQFLSVRTLKNDGTFGPWIHLKNYSDDNAVASPIYLLGGNKTINWSGVYKKYILSDYEATSPVNILIINPLPGELTMHLYHREGKTVNLPSGWWVNGEIKTGYNVLTFQYLLAEWGTVNWKVINIAQYDLIP